MSVHLDKDNYLISAITAPEWGTDGTFFFQLYPNWTQANDSIEHNIMLKAAPTVGTSGFYFNKYTSDNSYIGFISSGTDSRIVLDIVTTIQCFVPGVWSKFLFDWSESAQLCRIFNNNEVCGIKFAPLTVPSGLTQLTIGCHFSAGVTTASANCDFAEGGRWNRRLTDEEHLTLQETGCPLSVPDGLVQYYRLLNKDYVTEDLCGTLPLMVQGTLLKLPLQSGVSHPALYYPASVIDLSLEGAPALTLHPPLLSSPITLYTPSLSQSAPAGALLPPLLSLPITLFPPSLTVAAPPEPPVGVGVSTYPPDIDTLSNLIIAANNKRSTVVAELSISGMALTVADASTWPTSGAVTLDVPGPIRTPSSSEICYYGARSGNVLTLTARAQGGTTAKLWAVGMTVEMRAVAEHHNLHSLAIIALQTEVETKLDSTALDAALAGKADVSHTHPTLLPLTGGTLTGALTLAGPPASDLHAATKLYVDSTTGGAIVGMRVFNARDYGATGNGTTDDTAAIQALINTVAAQGGGRIYFPRGEYIIAGPLQDVGGLTNANAQIKMPERSDFGPPMTIDIVGEVTPINWHWNNTKATGTNFSILKSTLTGQSGEACMFGSAKPAASEFTNALTLNFKDMIIELPPNPTITGLDFSNLQANRIQDVLIYDGAFGGLTHAEPTHNNSYGAKLPPNFHSGRIRLDNLWVFGLYWGFRTGELTSGLAVVQTCRNGIETIFTHHPSKLDFLGVLDCAYGIIATNGSPFRIDLLDIEDGTATGMPWQALIADIYDPGNTLHGSFVWSKVISPTGIGHTLVKVGGTSFIGTELW